MVSTRLKNTSEIAIARNVYLITEIRELEVTDTDKPKLNRRGFFKILAGAAIAPVAAKVAALLPNVLTLWGDNIHDDAPALTALLSGDVVEFANVKMAKNVGWNGGVLTLPEGTFRLDAPLNIDDTHEGIELIAHKTTLRCSPSID